MLTTARHAHSAAIRATVTRHIDAPTAAVWSLLADVHAWPRWGPFTDISTPHLDRHGLVVHPIRLGRHQLRVAITSPDAPYWLRYRLTGGPARALHTAEITLSPTDDGGTDLQWRATPTRPLIGTARRRAAALVTAVAELAAQLASAAEDPATTRVDWAAAQPPVGSATPRRVAAAATAGNAMAA